MRIRRTRRRRSKKEIELQSLRGNDGIRAVQTARSNGAFRRGCNNFRGRGRGKIGRESARQDFDDDEPEPPSLPAVFDFALSPDDSLFADSELARFPFPLP